MSPTVTLPSLWLECGIHNILTWYTIRNQHDILLKAVSGARKGNQTCRNKGEHQTLTKQSMTHQFVGCVTYSAPYVGKSLYHPQSACKLTTFEIAIWHSLSSQVAIEMAPLRFRCPTVHHVNSSLMHIQVVVSMEQTEMHPINIIWLVLMQYFTCNL